MKLIFIVLLILSVLSCSNKKSNIAKGVKTLKSKSIVLPNNAVAIVNSLDTTIADFMYADLKLVVYTNSVGCTSCGISKMHNWDNLINYAKVYGGRLKYYFIYAPAQSKVKSVKLILRDNKLDYPILLDTTHEFEKLNPHLPKNKALHTFLLDENNNVILVGNPLHNAQIEQMFYKKVEEKLMQN